MSRFSRTRGSTPPISSASGCSPPRRPPRTDPRDCGVDDHSADVVDRVETLACITGDADRLALRQLVTERRSEIDEQIDVPAENCSIELAVRPRSDAIARHSTRFTKNVQRRCETRSTITTGTIRKDRDHRLRFFHPAEEHQFMTRMRNDESGPPIHADILPIIVATSGHLCVK